MRKSLLLSSITLLFFSLFYFSCKVKQTNEAKNVSNKQPEVSKENRYIHAPGVQNLKQLDSLKAVRMQEKLKIKHKKD